jgi:hypothetical protein
MAFPHRGQRGIHVLVLAALEVLIFVENDDSRLVVSQR